MGEKTLSRRYLQAAIKFAQRIVVVVAGCFFRIIYGTHGPKVPPIKDLLLLESASSIALKIRTRKITSEQVLNSFIERIAEINPLLNCVVANRFEQARKEAKAADELVKSGTLSESDLAKSKPFLGVPFTTKDCIAVEGMIHTAGLYSRKDIVAEKDADTILALRNAGAIAIGLTNVSELCMWWESANPVHGRTSNPYDVNHIVGGSSGGEGCNQAAAGSAFGIGSDIGGSIRMPAFFNGVFGHKPSKHIVSSEGQYPIPWSQQQKDMLSLGPICRHAKDLRPLLKVMAGKNAGLLGLDEAVDLSRVRFHYQEWDGGDVLVSPVNSEIKNLLRRTVLYLDKAHKIKAEKVQIRRFQKSTALWIASMNSEDGPTFDQQLANLNGSISVSWEFVKWCFRMSNHTFIALVTTITERLGPKVGSEKHGYLQREVAALKTEMDDLLGRDGVLLYPTHPTPAPYHNEPLVKPFNFAYTGIVNVMGLPATHCPMGLDSQGLPIGIQVISNDRNDRLCLAVAEELEKAFGGWVPPELEA